MFGLSAGMIACYKGISVGGGPAGVGNAVNETVVSRCDRLEAPFQFPWLKSRFGGAPFDVRAPALHHRSWQTRADGEDV